MQVAPVGWVGIPLLTSLPTPRGRHHMYREDKYKDRAETLRRKAVRAEKTAGAR